MPFARPSLGELITRIRGDILGRLGVSGPLLRRAMADALAAVWAGGVHTLYGFLDFLAKQLFLDTAEREELLRRARMYGIVPTAATFATGFVAATGVNGTAILAGTIFRLDAATAYRVTTGQTISSGFTSLPVVALLAGAASNLPGNTHLPFESPVPGVNAIGIVSNEGIAGGAEQQGTEEVRDRLRLRLQQPPAGGRDPDYVGFALSAPGVARAWTFPLELGKGTVVVRFVGKDEDGGVVFPDGAAVAAVQAVLDAQRPITAIATAAAPSALAVNFTIHVVPDNADTRAAITAELVDLINRVAEPGDGVGRGKVLRSQVLTALGAAEGVTDYTLTVPSVDIVPGTGLLPTIGTITWV